MSVLITGASGTLGRTVARRFTASGHAAVLGTRTPETLAARGVEDADVRRLDFADPSSFSGALHGITEVLLIAPLADAHSDQKLKPFVEAALAHGVEHFVVNSAHMATLSETFVLRRLERLVEASGRGWTHLRSQWYMSTLTRGLFTPMLRQGEYLLPVGPKDKIAYVAVQDVAEVAALVLTAPEQHSCKIYELTGPASLDGPTVASLCSDAWARPVVFRSLSEDAYAHACGAAGLHEDAVSLLLELFTAVRGGDAARTTTTVRDLTGHAPLDLRRILAEDP